MVLVSSLFKKKAYGTTLWVQGIDDERKNNSCYYAKNIRKMNQ